MKNIAKIAIIAVLALCLILAFASCNDEEFVYVTDEAGETVTDAEGNPVTVLVADSSDETSVGESKNIENEGANTEGGWGPLITPN